MAEKKYIEREAFKAEVRRLSTHYLNEWDTLGVLAAADRIPAADVRPVVRGKWVWNEAWVCGNPYGSYRCTACSATSPHTSGFCPNCGARMEES